MQLVKAHEQVAEILDMPVIKIEPKQALELERNVLIVLNDRGVVVRSERAHVFALVMCVIAIYGPIVLALIQKFVLAPGKVNSESGAPAPSRREYGMPAEKQESEMRQVNPSGLPEQDQQIMPDGTRVAGAFIVQRPDLTVL